VSLSPAEAAVRADLESARFRAGALRGHWRLDQVTFPLFYITVVALTGRQARTEFCFRFEVTDFPTQAPEVKIWDLATGGSLPLADRPKGPARVMEAFKDGWPGLGAPSVYRPWERHGVNHNNWATTYPHLRWLASRDLTFVLEDLYALINPSTAAMVLA
jgi:hypothetical protein